MSNNKMAVEVFKSSIIRIRDILRGPGISITGMDGMRHISLYIMSRFLTKDKTEYIGIPEKFSWENIMELTKHKDPNIVLELFYHESQDNLVFNLDKLFETRKFSFDIKHPQKHKEIIEILNNIDIDSVDCEIDILGWVYEQHLKTGAGAARDLGQFFTDRFICNYMTKLCNPKCKAEGVPESMCDPTMGTGGFITSYIKYFKDIPIDWKVQQKEIFGCDTDPKVVGISCMNAFMETKGKARFENLKEQDSLYNDLIRNGYDIILANMPFGLKGIKHADCCKRVKELKINGTKSEPLFLQLMMVSLNPGGRCAVVVPDGMLVNSSSCHNGTRKYLLDNFEVKRIIKMKGKFFMNTGIQPSIIFFEKSGYSTGNVEFWEVERNEKDEFKETMVVSVPRDKFDESCSFDARKYMETEKSVVNPAGFPMVKLGDIAFNKKYPQHDTSVGKESGSCKFHTGGEYTRLYTDNPDIHDTVIIINRTNGSGKSNIFIDSNCSAAKQTLIISCENNITTKYIFYWISLNKNEIEKGYIGSNHKNLSSDFLKNMIVPFPPLPIQQEIVAILNEIYESINNTNKFAISLKKQMKILFDTSLKFKDSNYDKIESFCNFEKSKIQASKNIEGEYPFISLKTSTHNENTLEDFEHVFISAIPQGNRLMKVKFHKGKCSYSSLMFHCKLDKNIILPKYFYYYLINNMDILNEYVIGVQPKFNYESFLSRKIIIPSLKIQNEIINSLNIMEESIIKFESLQEQSEYNAKFILDSYLSSNSIEITIPESKEEVPNIEFPEDI
jgi:restriction endonuclease S subunit